MTLRIAGAFIILAGSFYWGHLLSFNYTKNISDLRQIIDFLDYIIYELQYRRIPLAEAIRRASANEGSVNNLFTNLASQLECNSKPDVEACINSVLSDKDKPSKLVAQYFRQIGFCIGKFNLSSQLEGLRTVRAECDQALLKLNENKSNRLQGYKTYALCLGAGIIIALL